MRNCVGILSLLLLLTVKFDRPIALNFCPSELIAYHASDETPEAIRQLFEVMSQQARTVRITPNVNGLFSATYSQSGVWHDSRLRMFESAALLDDLELVGEQRKRIEQLVTVWRSEIDSAFTRLQNSDSPEGRFEQFRKDVNQINAKHEKLFLDELIPLQKQWLSQLHFRYLLQVFGPYELLAADCFQELGIRERDLDKVKISMKKEFSQFNKELREIKARAIESLEKELPGEFVIALQREWHEVWKDNPTDVDALRCYLELSDEAIDSAFESKLYSELNFPQFFELDVTGKWILKRDSHYPKDRDSPVHKIIAFATFCKEDGFIEFARISRRQADMLDSLNSKFQSTLQELNSEYLRVSSEKSTNDSERIFEAIERSQESLYESFWNSVAEVLLPAQIEAFETYVEKKVVRSRGPFYDLLNGDLGKNLSISELQKTNLRRQIDRVNTKMDEDIAQMSHSLFEKFIGEFEPEAQKAMNRLLGTDRKFSPNCALILLSFF